MVALTLIIHIFLGSTLAGSAVILALVLGYTTAAPIVVAALLGFAVALPAGWLIAKRLA